MKAFASRTIVLRTGLLLALVAGLAIISLNYRAVRTKIAQLQATVAQEQSARAEIENALADTKRNLETTTARFEGELQKAAADLDQTRSQMAAQMERQSKLNEELAVTRRERDEAQAGLARFKAAGMEPEQIITAAKEIKELQGTVAGLQEENRLFARRLSGTAETPGGDVTIFLPASFRAKVLAHDPKWNFVVLDAGENQGALKGGELLLSRGGELIAKVRINAVEKGRCVANLVPGWELGTILENDVAIPAHPAQQVATQP